MSTSFSYIWCPVARHAMTHLFSIAVLTVSGIDLKISRCSKSFGASSTANLL